MRLRTIVLITLLALVSTGFGSSHKKIVNHTTASVVRITGEADMMTWAGLMHVNYVCTGFVIAPERVMTAAHCVGDNMLADGTPALVLKADRATDLAVLSTKTHKKPLVLIENSVERGDDLTAIGYGFGWRVDDSNGRKNIGHSGSTSGFSASLQRFPEDKLTVIVLCNSGEQNIATTLARAIAEFYFSSAGR